MAGIRERLSKRVAERRMASETAGPGTYYSFGNQEAGTWGVAHFELKTVPDPDAFKKGAAVTCNEPCFVKALTELVGRLYLFEKQQLYPEDEEEHMIPFWRLSFQRQSYSAKLPIQGGRQVTIVVEQCADGSSRLLGDIRWNCNAAVRPAMPFPTYVIVHDVSFHVADEALPRDLFAVCDFSEDALTNLLFVLSDAGSFVYTKVLPYLRFDVNEWSRVAADMMYKLGYDYKRIDLPTPDIISRVFRLKHAASLINQTAILNETEEGDVDEKPTKSKKKRDLRKQKKEARAGAAVCIQKSWRRFVTAQRYAQLRCAAVATQPFVRAFVVRSRIRGLLMMRSFLERRWVECERDASAERVTISIKSH